MRLIKTLIINIVAIFLLIYALVYLSGFVLNLYTRHGESITLPDVKGIDINDAISVIEKKKLRYVITDTVYSDAYPKSSVVEQNPSPNSKVKEGRFIYLTINASSSEAVAMPNLINSSLRFAETVLTNYRLNLGQIIYKPDIAQNAVLDQLYNGQSIQPNVKIPKGSKIDLVVGDGMGGTEVSLPDLSGLSLIDATNVLKSSLLTIGAIVYDGPTKDSLSAKVVRQNPPYYEEATIKSGQSVDLFLSVK